MWIICIYTIYVLAYIYHFIIIWIIFMIIISTRSNNHIIVVICKYSYKYQTFPHNQYWLQIIEVSRGGVKEGARETVQTCRTSQELTRIAFQLGECDKIGSAGTRNIRCLLWGRIWQFCTYSYGNRYSTKQRQRKREREREGEGRRRSDGERRSNS